jgi:hypothetical protein
MTAPYLATLNPEQRHAVEYGGDQPLLIAGAGSGKTNTLEIKSSARQRRLSAMHEAGHAVIARTLGIKVASAEIFLRSGVYNWGGLIKYDHVPDVRQDQQRLSIAGAVGEWCWGEFVAGRPSDPADYLYGDSNVDFGLDLGPDLNPNLALIALDMSNEDRWVDEKLFDFDTAPKHEKIEWYDAMHWVYNLINPFTGKLWPYLQREARRLIIASRFMS